MREETAEENTAPHGAETQLQEDTSRLMPFLVGSRAAATYSSVAQRPGSDEAASLVCGSAIAWPKKPHGQEPQDCLDQTVERFCQEKLTEKSAAP